MHEHTEDCPIKHHMLGREYTPVVKYPDVAMSALMSLDPDNHLKMVGAPVLSRLYNAACEGGIVFW